MLLRYSGHTGSVNSIAFHPRETIVCTGSGDNTMHIWSSNVNIPLRSSDKSVSIQSKVRFGMFFILVYMYLGVLVVPLTCRV